MIDSAVTTILELDDEHTGQDPDDVLVHEQEQNPTAIIINAYDPTIDYEEQAKAVQNTLDVFNKRFGKPGITQSEVLELRERWLSMMPVVSGYFNIQGPWVASKVNEITVSIARHLEPSDENVLLLKEQIRNLADAGYHPMSTVFLLKNIYRDNSISQGFKEVCHQVISDYVDTVIGDGFTDEAISGIRNSDKEIYLERYWDLYMNIRFLENENPGICKVLYEKFGIVNFSRYSKELLIQQAGLSDEQITDADTLVISSVADHNGAISAVVEEVSMFEEQIGDKDQGTPIFVEASGLDKLTEIGSAILAIRKGKPFERMYIDTHGNEDNITFGYETDGYLDIKTLTEKGHDIVPLLYDLTTEHSLIICLGCYTGVDTGIARILSFLQCRIIGPDSKNYSKEDIDVPSHGPDFRLRRRPSMEALKKLEHDKPRQVNFQMFYNGLKL
jgi:hypothetical protein